MRHLLTNASKDRPMIVMKILFVPTPMADTYANVLLDILVMENNVQVSTRLFFTKLFIQFCLGKIWHGDSTIATIAATDTIYGYGPDTLFDNNFGTQWRGISQKYVFPTLTITFKKLISFQGVIFTPSQAHNYYSAICVYLDKSRIHPGAEEACSAGKFRKQFQKFTVSASRPKQTNEVHIRFSHYNHAHLSELEIIYNGKLYSSNPTVL